MTRAVAALLIVVCLPASVWAGSLRGSTSAAGATPEATAHSAAAGLSRLGYVGRVPGTNAFIGIVVRDDAVTAYVCDSRTLAQWFRGRITAGRAVLRSASGARIELRIGGTARGVLRLPGRKALPFVAVAARGRAGLFRADRALTKSGKSVRVLTGWVRLGNGSLRGASVTSNFRILSPAPGVTAVLVAETGGTITAPGAQPAPGERVTGTAVPICKWFTGATSAGRKVSLTTPGCGIARAGVKPPGSTGPSVTTRPTDFRLSQAALTAFATGMHDQFTTQRAALLKLAQQSDPDPPASARAVIAKTATAMLGDSKLLEAAERLRQGGTPAEVADRTAGYKRVAGPQFDSIQNVLPPFNPLVAIFSRTGLTATLPARQTYRGPWADVSHITTSGDDWTYEQSAFRICRDFLRCSPLADIAAGATNVRAHVRAGFNSSITWDRAHLLTFDIPASPTARDVEVEIDGAGVDIAIDSEDCFGTAWGWATAGYSIYAVSDGLVAGEPITGVILDSLFGDPTQTWTAGPVLGTLVHTNDCVPNFAPPVPPPASVLIVGDEAVVLKFTAPPQGGTYALSASVTAHADVVLGGTSVTQARIGVDLVTVRHG
jgi:hypothetical protein